MDVFKLRPGDDGEFQLTEDTYFEKTNRQSPYENRSLSEQGTIYFATCPECENLIEIRNLVKSGAVNHKSPKEPFGQHYLHGHSATRELARGGVVNTETYEDCSYAGDVKLGRKTPRKNGKVNDQMLLMLIEHAWVIKRAIHPCIGVNMGEKLFEKIIEQFVVGGGYRYRAANTRNLPYAVAFMAENQSLMGQFIRKEDDAFVSAITGSSWFTVTDGRITRKANEKDNIPEKDKVPRDADIRFFFSRFKKSNEGSGEPNSMLFTVKAYRGKEAVSTIYTANRTFNNRDFSDDIVRFEASETDVRLKWSGVVRKIVALHRPDLAKM